MANVTVTLATPVSGEDGPISALDLREPVGIDIRQCGVPYAIGENGAVALNAEAVHKLIARLSGQAGFVVDRLSAADWNRCLGVIMGFFGAPTPETP